MSDNAIDQHSTSSGIEIQRVYGPSPAPREERPGEPPFTRGIHKNMYRGRVWTMRQYAGFGTASETNKRFRWLLDQGQTGLSTAFDLPTQIGLDADDPKAQGEVGRVGVHIGTLADMETLFDRIPLDKVSTSLTINATASVLLAFYVAVAKKRGVDPKVLRGTLQNDILKEFIARGTYIYPPKVSLRLCADTIEYSTRHLPNFHPISISGYHIREAGSTAAQEIAFTFANAKVYVRALLDRGLAIDDFGPRLAFFFGCHNHLLEEIAKFRAARRIWHRIMREEFAAKDAKTLGLKFHVQTCGSTLTSQQPANNVIRVALQAMAAVLGGTQSLHTNAFDEALGLPTEESAQVALRTQQILAHETGVPQCADPLGGAYAIEALTDALEGTIVEQIKRIEERGGMLDAISAGVPQAEIQEAAYRYQSEIEQGRRKIVGINCYALEKKEASGKKILKVSPKLEQEQVRRLKAFRKSRDTRKAQRALESLERASGGTENLFPSVLDAVESQATLGEICGVLRKMFGEHKG